MNMKLKEAPTLINAKESHQAALAKERHMQKLKDALKISDKHEFGAAFDLELQEQKRLQKLAEREKLRKEKKRAKKEAARAKEREEVQRELNMVKKAEAQALPEEGKVRNKRSRSSSSSSSSSGSSSQSSSSSSSSSESDKGRNKRRSDDHNHHSSRR
jgi:hypothetical protein